MVLFLFLTCEFLSTTFIPLPHAILHGLTIHNCL